MQGSPIDVLKTKIQYNSKTQKGGSSISVILQLYIIFLIAELRVRFFFCLMRELKVKSCHML